MSNTETKKEMGFNEGLTIQNDKQTNSVDWVECISSVNLVEGRFSFVKITNLSYLTKDFDGFYFNPPDNMNTEGLSFFINPNELVKEWIGVVLHLGVGVKKEYLKEWLGRYCGGIEDINDNVMLSEPMEVFDFDFEVIPNEEMIKMYPCFGDVIKDEELDDDKELETKTNKIGNK
jgi:hypothetical protein